MVSSERELHSWISMRTEERKRKGEQEEVGKVCENRVKEDTISFKRKEMGGMYKRMQMTGYVRPNVTFKQNNQKFWSELWKSASTSAAGGECLWELATPLHRPVQVWPLFDRPEEIFPAYLCDADLMMLWCCFHEHTHTSSQKKMSN